MFQDQYQDLLPRILLAYMFFYQFTHFKCHHLCWRHNPTVMLSQAQRPAQGEHSEVTAILRKLCMISASVQ